MPEPAVPQPAFSEPALSEPALPEPVVREPEGVARTSSVPADAVAGRARGPVPAMPASLLIPVLWVLSLLLLAGAVFAAWHWRASVAHAWPPSLRLYRLIPGAHLG